MHHCTGRPRSSQQFKTVIQNFLVKIITITKHRNQWTKERQKNEQEEKKKKKKNRSNTIENNQIVISEQITKYTNIRKYIDYKKCVQCMLYYAQISLILSTNDDHNTIQHHHSRLPGVMFENASKRKKGRRTKKEKKKKKEEKMAANLTNVFSKQREQIEKQK